MATRTFLGTVNTDWNTAGNWDGGVALPSAGDALVVSSNTVMDADDANAYLTISVDPGITFDQVTFNITCTGAFTCAGTYSSGASAGTGLTCGSFVGSAGWTRDWANTSKINCGGNFNLNATGTYVTGKGNWTQTGNATIAINGNSAGLFRVYTQNTGISIASTDGNPLNLTGTISSSTNIDGPINHISTSFLRLGCIATGTFTLGANFVLNGVTTGTTNFKINTGATIVNNSTLSGSYTGTISAAIGSVDVLIPKIIAPLCTLSLSYAEVASVSIRIAADVFYCAKITNLDTANTAVCTFDNSTYNTSFVVTGNIDLRTGVLGTFNYTRGTGTYTLSDGAASINFNSKTVEEVNVTSGDKSIVTSFTTAKLSGSAGTIHSSVVGTARTITVGADSSVSRIDFKDITIAGGTVTDTNGNDLGNNTNIIFISADTGESGITVNYMMTIGV